MKKYFWRYYQPVLLAFAFVLAFVGMFFSGFGMLAKDGYIVMDSFQANILFFGGLMFAGFAPIFVLFLLCVLTSLDSESYYRLSNKGTIKD